MTRWTGVALALLAVSASWGAASASLIPVFQIRTVSGVTFIEDADGSDQDFEHVEAPDFEPFDARAEAQVSRGIDSTHAVARQQSTIGPSLVSWESTLDVSGSSSELGQIVEVFASSRLTLMFDLPRDGRWEIEASIEVSDGSFGLFLEDVDLGTTLFELQVPPFGGEGSGSEQVATALDLPAGRYGLDLLLWTEIFPFVGESAGHASASVRFAEVPEPGTLLLLGTGLLGIRSRIWRKSV